MRYVFLPHEIADIFTLAEALNWVAFKQVALRDDLKLMEEIFEESRSIANDAAYSFPWAEDHEASLQPYPEEPSYPSPALLKAIGKPLPDNFVNKCKAVHQEYEQKIHEADLAYEDKVGVARAAIFLALKEGRLKAKGHLIYQPKPKTSPSHWEEEDYWQDIRKPSTPPPESSSPFEEVIANQIYNPADFENPEDDFDEIVIKIREAFDMKVSDIPSDFWLFNGIHWDISQAKSPKAWYEEVHVTWADLVEVFPPPATKPIPLLSCAGFVTFDETSAHALEAKVRRGRPVKFNWAPFHIEMVKRLQAGSLPDKQEACIADMAEWFMQNQGQSPQRTALLENISPYYNELKK